MTSRTAKFTTAILGAVVLLGACSPSTQAEPQQTETAATTESTVTSSDPSGSESSVREGIIDPEAYLIAVISDGGYQMGDLVTATFELRDEGDQILSSGHESKRFMTGNDLVFPMRMKLPDGIDAASAHVSIVIEAEDREIPSAGESADLEVGSTVLSTIDNKPVLAFNVENTSSLVATKARMDVVCYDEADRIIGGGEAVPPNLEPHAKLGMHAVLVTTGDPESCEIFPVVLQSQEPTKTTGDNEDEAEKPANSKE